MMALRDDAAAGELRRGRLGAGLRRARQLDHVGVHDLRGDELGLHVADEERACCGSSLRFFAAAERELARVSAAPRYAE